MDDVGLAAAARTDRLPRLDVMPPSSRAPWYGLGATVVLVTLAMAVPAITGWQVHVPFPPLNAVWAPRVGIGTVPALLIAGLGIWQATDLAARLPWKRLLLAVYGTGLAWMFSLAYVDGKAGVGTILGTPNEYLTTARATTNLHHTLEIYVSRIALPPPDGWPVHIAGHPPGALTFFVALDRIGLGSTFMAGVVVTLIAATTALALLTTLRVLGAENHARKAAPFLVLGPAAIWQCVSADAVFAAFAAWGLATLAFAATRRTPGAMLCWSVLSGLFLGYCVMLSYGLPLLAVLALAVLLLARSWRPLVPAALAATAVVLLYAGFGFNWWDAYPALRHRYWAGVARIRPTSYWLWGDLAALALSAGPLVGAGLAQAASQWRTRITEPSGRVVLLLPAAAAASIVLADGSLLSKAEVERIWLPFVGWLLVACSLLPESWRRRGLVLQVVVALALQHLLATGW
ncbi:MAG: hypothetical protein JWQ32_2093 [Marmoricola sp.]|nr:hypothetical protein [Marmoricola sp.]